MMSENYQPKIEQIDATSYRVYSESNHGRYYITSAHSCTCPDFKFRGTERDCKHQKALKVYLVEQEIKKSSSTHEHRIRCIGCNFRTTIERCSCSEPDKQEFLCCECQGIHATEQWREVNGKNEDCN